MNLESCSWYISVLTSESFTPTSGVLGNNNMSNLLSIPNNFLKGKRNFKQASLILFQSISQEMGWTDFFMGVYRC